MKLSLVNLLGTAKHQYGWVYYGEIGAQVSKADRVKSGFSVCFNQAVEFEQDDLQLSENLIKPYFKSDPTLRHACDIPDKEFWTILMQYQFRIKGQGDWFAYCILNSDIGCKGTPCCDYRAYIVKVGRFDKIICNHSYCDV